MTEQERYESELNRAVFEKGLDKITYSDILVCKNTPKILIDIGFEDLPILFSKKHFYSAIKNYNAKKHRKGLDLYNHIYKIPYMLSNPAIVLNDIQLEKDTQRIMQNNKHSGDIVVISENVVYIKEINKTFPIAISIKGNSYKGKYDGIKKNNHLITIFGHDNIENTICEAVKNNYILYYDKEKIQEIDQFTGKSLSNALSSLESNIIIQKYTKNVKLL